MIVATDNLSKEYDGVYRVQELDIQIKEGDIYGFLGPNGAGKSTTMKMLLGLVKPTSGTIEIMGKPFNDISPSYPIFKIILVVLTGVQ